MTWRTSQPVSLEPAEAECSRLREENARLRRLLAEHNILIPPSEPPMRPFVTASSLDERQERARKRIALFRSLFRGREDVSHGGRLWVTPHSGPGATFQFTLPIEATEQHRIRSIPGTRPCGTDIRPFADARRVGDVGIVRYLARRIRRYGGYVQSDKTPSTSHTAACADAASSGCAHGPNSHEGLRVFGRSGLWSLGCDCFAF
jgi:hypothetical protein